VTLSAGTAAFPWRRFALFDAVAALIWGIYASLLGYFGGKAFEDAPWKGLLLALGIAFAVAGGVEGVRWYMKRRKAGGRPGSALCLTAGPGSALCLTAGCGPGPG
jgi:membrane-associated protein